MSETCILIRLLRMCFPWNWEFGSALSKLRNFGEGGLNPQPPPPSVRFATCWDVRLWSWLFGHRPASTDLLLWIRYWTNHRIPYKNLISEQFKLLLLDKARSTAYNETWQCLQYTFGPPEPCHCRNQSGYSVSPSIEPLIYSLPAPIALSFMGR
jgi:hypothetical protein